MDRLFRQIERLRSPLDFVTLTVVGALLGAVAVSLIASFWKL